MAHRYRMDPTDVQATMMAQHCAQARYVWNLALEQTNLYRPHRGATPNHAQRKHQLAEARQCSWLGEGSSHVQQAALRDFDQAMRNWWGGSHRRPTWRKQGQREGFTIRDLSVNVLNRKWATVHVPKVGPVKLRLSRPLPVDTKSARVTLDRAGRWHVSFTSIPDRIDGPGDGPIVGVDRGVVIPFQSSDGRSWEVPGLRPTEATRLLRLQRRMARQQKGSNRRARTKVSIARLRAREVDRRKDAIEKATTELARTADIVRLEDLRIPNMVRSAKGTIEEPGTNVRAKAGLNRAIQAQGWGLFAQRLGHKIGDRLELVPAANTSRRCAVCKHVAKENRKNQAVFECVKCGHRANADVNAAVNIAAGRAVSGRGGYGAMRSPREASINLVGVA